MIELHSAVNQYLEGAITYAELINFITQHYLEAQRNNMTSCASCGSDLSKRLG